MPEKIEDKYMWKGKWSAADNEDVGVPLTQCAAEGKNLYLRDYIFVCSLFCSVKKSIFQCCIVTYFVNKYVFSAKTYLFT